MKEKMNYDTAWAELQEIVRAIQEERTGIDELSAKIARATELIRFCRDRLRQTETELGKLVEDPPEA